MNNRTTLAVAVMGTIALKILHSQHHLNNQLNRLSKKVNDLIKDQSHTDQRTVSKLSEITQKLNQHLQEVNPKKVPKEEIKALHLIQRITDPLSGPLTLCKITLEDVKSKFKMYINTHLRSEEAELFRLLRQDSLSEENYNRITTLIQENPILVFAKQKESNLSPLFYAVSKELLACTRLFISHGADINEKSSEFTALEMSISKNNTSLITLLLENNASVNKDKDKTSSPLIIAILENNDLMSVIQLLLDQGCIPTNDEIAFARLKYNETTDSNTKKTLSTAITLLESKKNPTMPESEN